MSDVQVTVVRSLQVVVLRWRLLPLAAWPRLAAWLCWLGMLLGPLHHPAPRALAQSHLGHAHRPRVTAPKVFLDKSPRVVEYQLGRLSNEQLLMIESSSEDPLYEPVFLAILTREGMPSAERAQALTDLVTLTGKSPVDILVQAIIQVSRQQGAEATSSRLASLAMRPLAEMLIKQDGQTLAADLPLLESLLEFPRLAPMGYAAVAQADWETAGQWAADRRQLEELLRAVPLMTSVVHRESLRETALSMMTDGTPLEQRRAALMALSAMVPVDPEVARENFGQVAELIEVEELRADVIHTLLVLREHSRNHPSSSELCQWLVEYAEASSIDERAEDVFLDALQLVEELLLDLEPTDARQWRQRLGKTIVRVIRLRTVEEQMRYDLPFFAVQAGSDVQIVLVNDDIMPHNWVLCQPGTMQAVAILAAEEGPEIGSSGLQYVPDDPRVLAASHMVAPLDQDRVALTAPGQPGEYPYVCTYPGHWMRMYGVMVVVEDLESWLQDPRQPTDPLGNHRQFVQSWTIDDFGDDLENDLRGRSPELGQRLFVEAGCAQCHRAGPDLQLNRIGPDLSESLAKWKGDPRLLLREIIDPSYHVDPEYAVHLVITDSGATISGLLVAETDDSLSLLENVEAQAPAVISKKEIEVHRRSNSSWMPKGLLDQFSRDEVLEILSFLISIQHGE